jgi:hypothetical protein
MPTALLPDRMLKLMSAADRKAIGQTTAAEALAIAEAKSERELQEQIASILRHREVVYIRPAMFRRSQLPVGWPDFTFCHKSRAIGLECKSKIGEPTHEQLEMHAHMEANGWEVHIVRSLAKVIEIFNEIEGKSVPTNAPTALGEIVSPVPFPAPSSHPENK